VCLDPAMLLEAFERRLRVSEPADATQARAKSDGP
jgi:hypothetical protein